jgi:hypothetical protein
MFLVSRLVTLVYKPNIAFTIDDHRDRHCINLVQLADFFAGIEQHRKIHAKFAHHVHCLARIIIDIDTEQSEANTLVARIQLVEQRHLLSARSAPGCPEIDHHDVATILGQPQVLAARTLERKIGCLLARQTGTSQAGRCQGTANKGQ